MIIVTVLVLLVLTACASNTVVEEKPSGSLAYVDLVSVELQGEHPYVKVEGNFPDSCTRVSDVQQELDGSSFNIELFVDRPEDLMCAQVISPFVVLILLEVGGVMPGEYSVDVNGVVGSFTLGP